jgi:hypothetical protein
MSLARNLGLFFGHIAKAVRSDPSSPREPHASDVDKPQVASREVARRELTAQTVIETPEGPREVTLRRTVIDEVEVPTNEQSDAHR